MEKRDIAVLSQLLSGIKDSINELKRAYEEKNIEKLASAKNEILSFQKKVDKLL